MLSLAKQAKAVGVELFVLDDGWFGERNSDTAGLGDYTVNRKKLPGGIEGLAQKITAMGLRFGLWFEPEAVNPDSPPRMGAAAAGTAALYGTAPAPA